MSDIQRDSRVLVQVPAVENIGPGFSVRGTVVRAEPGELVVVFCDDDEIRWRSADELTDLK